MEIDPKNLKDILKEQREEYQHYLSAVIESFDSHVKVIADTMVGIQEQLLAIREMVARNTEDIEIIKMDLHLIKNELKEKVGRDEFKTLERRLESVEKKLQISPVIK